MTEAAVPLFTGPQPPFRSVGCAACGDCCDPVWAAPPETFRHTLDRYEQHAAPYHDAHPEEDDDGRWWDRWQRNAADARWMLSRMTPLDPQPDNVLPNGMEGDSGQVAYTCSAFDPVSRLCTAHDARPPICSGYPWYGGRPEGEHPGMHGRCSYWRDLPPEQRTYAERPLIPLADVTARLSTG